MEADPAFRGAAVDVVLDPVAGEDLELPVVHLDRNRDDYDGLGMLELLVDTGVELDLLRHPVELAEGELEGVAFRGLFHFFSND